MNKIKLDLDLILTINIIFKNLLEMILNLIVF